MTGPNALVAPAGYGKTHTIALSVKALRPITNRDILVLTHTNAGITSIKQKFSKEQVGTKGVSIFTIAGFLQKIVQNLSNETIEQGADSNHFYAALYEKALCFFQENLILKGVIENSYEHVFVDEYQDCNLAQYSIIRIFSHWNLKVHLLLDPLQTIFNFDINHPDYLSKITATENSKPDRIFRLNIPYRWHIANSPLEHHIPLWRESIEMAITNGTNSIDLSSLSGIRYFRVTNQEAVRILNSSLYRSSNVLVIHSQYGKNNEIARGNVCQLSGYKLRLIESIDNKAFYTTAQSVDKLMADGNCILEIVALIYSNCGVSSTPFGKWIKNNHIVQKKSPNEVAVSNALTQALNLDNRLLSLLRICKILKSMAKLSVKRVELLDEIMSAIESSIVTGTSIEDGIEMRRNYARIQGRTLYGRVIGTTLLTKGLEADSVILLKPSYLLGSRTGMMHLYVALTRAIREVTLIDYKEENEE